MDLHVCKSLNHCKCLIIIRMYGSGKSNHNHKLLVSECYGNVRMCDKSSYGVYNLAMFSLWEEER